MTIWGWLAIGGFVVIGSLVQWWERRRGNTSSPSDFDDPGSPYWGP